MVSSGYGAKVVRVVAALLLLVAAASLVFLKMGVDDDDSDSRSDVVAGESKDQRDDDEGDGGECGAYYEGGAHEDSDGGTTLDYDGSDSDDEKSGSDCGGVAGDLGRSDVAVTPPASGSAKPAPGRKSSGSVRAHSSSKDAGGKRGVARGRAPDDCPEEIALGDDDGDAVVKPSVSKGVKTSGARDDCPDDVAETESNKYLDDRHDYRSGLKSEDGPFDGGGSRRQGSTDRGDDAIGPSSSVERVEPVFD